MDAIILAGGQTPADLLELTGCAERALIELHGRPMIAYVLEAVRATPGIDRVAVVAGDSTRAAVGELHSDVVLVPDTGKMIGNALAAAKVLGMPRVLVTTCDVPLVTAATYEELLAEFNRRHLEGAYAVSRRKVCEAAFPNGKRTYAHLVEDDYTAGNAVIVDGPIIEQMSVVFEQFYRARKNPLAMAKLLGMGFLVKAATKRLSVRDAENKMAELVGCKAGAVEMQDASIAFDVDKVEDYQVALEALAARQAVG